MCLKILKLFKRICLNKLVFKKIFDTSVTLLLFAYLLLRKAFYKL